MGSVARGRRRRHTNSIRRGATARQQHRRPELTAIDACMLRAEASPRGTEAPRLLILSDCNPAIEAVQTAEQTGSAWHLYKHHRPALLERISLRAARWRRAGGDLVIQWVCAHCGVFPNHYADVVAKAVFGVLIFAIAVRKSGQEPVLQAA